MNHDQQPNEIAKANMDEIDLDWYRSGIAERKESRVSSAIAVQDDGIEVSGPLIFSIVRWIHIDGATVPMDGTIDFSFPSSQKIKVAIDALLA